MSRILRLTLSRPGRGDIFRAKSLSRYYERKTGRGLTSFGRLG
jgi:hypothetical protein